MATKGFNPFLMEAESAAPGAADPQSNPFLSDFGGPPPAAAAAPDKSFGVGSDNPFMNPFGAPPAAAAPPPTGTSAFMFDDPAPVPPSSAGGNPFAMFGAPEPAAVPQAMSSNGPFGAPSDANSFFGATPAPAPVVETIFDHPQSEPADMVSLFDSGPSGDEDITGPLVPPPASVPPTTRELLDSVTGVLEATSDSLMDRLNQPSPVNLMPSPSPSPRSPSPDLLLGDEPPPPAPPSSANPLAPSPHKVDDIMDLFNAPPQPSGPKTTMDILGLYNTASSTAPAAAPPVPVAPPAAPPEPVSSLFSLAEPIVVPPTPAPNIPPAEPIIDLLDSEPPRPPTPAKTPTPATPVKELLSPIQQPVETEAASSPVSQVVPDLASPVKASPPERPKPPPPQVKSPVHEAKPLPSRPPPPVPPSPRHVPQPPAAAPAPPHPPPPAVPPQPVQPVTPTQPQSPMVMSPVQPPPAAVPEMAAPLQPAPPVVPPAPVVHAAPPPVPPQPRASPAKPPPPPVPHAPAFATDSTTASIFGAPVAPSIPAAFAPVVVEPPKAVDNPFADITTPPQPAAFAAAPAPERKAPSAFDDFDAKFNSISDTASTSAAFDDPFGGSSSAPVSDGSAWGSSTGGGGGFGDDSSSAGFGGDGFDSFLSLTEPPPVPQSTPAKTKKEGGADDDEADQDLSIFIKPRNENETFGLAPALAPPPKSPAISTNSAYSEDSASNTAFVPFLSSATRDTTYDAAAKTTQMNRTDSQETPQTPLFEEDTSQPLEDFPRTKLEAIEGWEMHMRHPNKKKITGQRFWKKVYVRIVVQNDIPIVHIYNQKGDKDPFQEIPLQACYSVSDISAQQFDQYGKIFTVKLQYVFYKERPGVRPGQVSKAGGIANRLSKFTAYAIQGDYQGVKEFGSDLKKLGLPVEHAPQISQLVKLGTQNYEEMKQFSAAIEEALFRLPVHRDRAIQYKTEEIQVTLVDEYYVEQDIYGVVTRQIARVRLFFLSFLSGVADVEMGMNDLRRQGKEVVGRHDIIPIATEEWIRTEAIEFSNCVQLDDYENTQTIKFKPPDASYIELLRFRVRPPKHRELPLQVKTVFTITGQRIEIRSDILVPGFTSRKLGQIPCEDVMIRFPIPEAWIYMFRVEKHFRYGSVKSAHRRSGKVKGIERLLGAVEAVEQSLMETTSGQAKYEHQHRSIVWRIPRLPKEGQGAYTTHSFFCHIQLQAHETIPENLTKQCFVEFTMPHTTISHTVVRSIAVPTCEEPPEKCVRYLSRHEYVVEIEHTQGFAPATYNLAAAVKKEEPKEESTEPVDRTQGWFPEEKPKADDDSDFSDD